jgi:hypothetical protein
MDTSGTQQKSMQRDPCWGGTGPQSAGAAQTVPRFIFGPDVSGSLRVPPVSRLREPPRPRPLPVRAKSPESTLSQGRAGGAGMRTGRARLGLDQRARLAEPHGRHVFLHQPPVYHEEEIMSWDAS